MYSDGMILKTVRKIGYSTAKPDKLDTIFFDYSLEHEGSEICSTFRKPACLWNESTNKINAHVKFGERYYVDKKVNSTRLSEYRWSRLFEDALQSMKKFELAEVEVMATEQFREGGIKVEKSGVGKEEGLKGLFGWGKDFEKAKKWLEEHYKRKYEEIVQDCKLYSSILCHQLLAKRLILIEKI